MKSERKIDIDDEGRIHMTDGNDHLYLAPASESQKRAALLPTEPTENATHVLGQIHLPETLTPTEERDYLPYESVEWIVDIQFEGMSVLDPRAVSEAFDREWRERYGGFTSYGRDLDTGRWTFLISSEGPRAVDQLKFAFDYIDILDEEAPLTTSEKYKQRLAAIREKMEMFGRPIISASLPPADAEARSRSLWQLKRELDMTATILLRAPQGNRFDGKTVWDVMLCLGMQWGDMDCFHWYNDFGVGDDSFFSVWTTTPPGYFLPEQVAADQVHVDDLVFSFSVPRCARPVEVFDSMVRAAEYSRKRLGGTICDESGRPLDPEKLRRQIKSVADRLKESGFQPGVDGTLRLF